ncbi:CSN-associated deubiquitinating enzyme Ubp12 [Metarhizium rileyi]|uniref:ubiquitinyl hydrolase 1 n=1 Tax=Metarhizium rileyi (strain RCEF 4871) TaxID=1649241 RepID=A0A5C6GG65_METRR|nr:CSN-associated deubiquitinating enzyme Ubp12 [Metarhizium rileyi]
MRESAPSDPHLPLESEHPLRPSPSSSSSPFAHELPGQLTVKTSSSKKRRLARPPPSTKEESDAPSSPSCELVLTLSELEPDDEPALFFSADSCSVTCTHESDVPRHPPSEPLPVATASRPPRLQHTHVASRFSADYASSTASSPCASACAELSLESDRGGDETGSARKLGRSQSPFVVPRRAIMNGDAELPQRSSSPLKRRASSMDPEDAPSKNGSIVDADGSQSSQQMNSSANDFPRAMSVDAPDVIGHDAALSQPPPPLLEQVKIIEMLLKAFAEAPVQEGSVAYLVSRTWVDKALALRTGSKSAAIDAETISLGPVDNTDIVQETIKDSSGRDFVRLLPGLGTESFELFPEDAWKLVMDWYGIKEGQSPIARLAVNTADSKQAPPNILYEFHPPVFYIHRLWSDVSTIPIEQSLKARNPPPLTMARSATTHAQGFLKEIKTLAGVNMERKVQLFTIPASAQVTGQDTERPLALTPPDSPGRPRGGNENRSVWPVLLVDVVSFSQVRDLRVPVPLIDHTANDKFNGQSTLQHYDLTTDQTLVLDEAIGNGFVSNYTGRMKTAEKSATSRFTASTMSSKTSSNRSSPVFDGPMTRGRVQKKRHGRSVGAVGLHNLGNTCYMNSALQCVRSVEELTKYFLTESYFNEINKSNVLGFEGRVAIAYGNLLREVYEEGRGSVSPRDFKSTVGRCRPTFSGWSQQDSQEFLGFLLDALQEDLSRIKKKPYIEKPDSTDDMINNPEAIKEMADKVWDITCRRDDSVIADLFTGLYKSTLKCPECGKISITFDPFNNLTLPLPLENMWSKSVKFFPLNDVPVKIEVELSRHSSIETLKHFISVRTGVPVKRLMGAEEFKDRFFKIYDNTQDVSEEIQSSDTPTIHELEAPPTNWPNKRPLKKYRSMLDVDTPLESAEWSEEECQTMVIPVLHRRPQISGRGPEGISPPHFITLTKEEASDYNIIQRKILQKVATFSTWSKLKDVQESDTSDSVESDMVSTSVSDADSGNSNIASISVEGEDDMVDITMKDAANGASNHDTKSSSLILKHFNSQAPKFTHPANFLIPELQNLFELCYFKNDTDGPVPTGWSSVDNSRALPRLADRIPESSVKDHDAPSPESSNSTGSGNEESGDEDETTPESAQTRMMEESSEEDAQPAYKVNGRSGRHNSKQNQSVRKKFKGHKGYGKKGNKRRDKQTRASKLAQRANAVAPQPMPPAVADGGPLIRLFEGIVVDWTEEAWDTVFGDNTNNPEAAGGSRTFLDLQTLHDPALEITQRRRVTRKTRGITLEECLDEFERAEILSEQDMWYCPRCKEHRRASKKFDLWKTPDILVAHLKRFSSSGWRRDKLDVLVDFPIEGLDLTSRVIQKEDGKAEIYDLIGVDDHYGGLGGGHYTAYAKNFVDGQWYNYNDSSVHVVSNPTSVITSAAYLLFYRRRSSGPLGGPRFKDIFDKFNEETVHSDNETTGSGEEVTTQGSTKTTVTALTGLDDEDELPLYGGNTIHRSIEDDDAAKFRGLDMTQGWSFNGLNGNTRNGTGDADCASDDAQFNSSDDDRGKALSEQDTDMTCAAPFEDGALWDDGDVISVPADETGEAASEEVAEIHLEGNKAARSDYAQ